MPSEINRPSPRIAFWKNITGISIAAVGLALFLASAAYLLSIARENYVGMNASQWVMGGSDKAGEEDKAKAPYDLAQQGVYIPPAREEGALIAKEKDAQKGAESGRRNCYEEPEYIEASDLCAQWANAAAMRFGNGIAAESYRLNYIVGFISALGVLLAAIGVILAAIASSAASRGVAMMAYGFMPILNISVRHHKPGFVRLTIKNVGTGPALSAVVESDGEKVGLAHERFAVDTSETVDLKVAGESMIIRATWRDIAEEPQVIERLFVKEGEHWRLAEDQPSQSD